MDFKFGYSRLLKLMYQTLCLFLIETCHLLQSFLNLRLA